MKNIRQYTRQLAFAFAAVAMFACESRADKERKPDVIKDYVENVISHNKIDQFGNHEIEMDAGYQTRLKEILKLCRTKDIEYLKENNIDIVLDSRLSQQEVSFWGDEVFAAYYNDGDQKVLSIWDNGKNDTSFWSRDYMDGAEPSISSLVQSLQNNEIKPENTVMLLDQYKITRTTRVGKTTSTTSTTHYKWRTPKDFNQRAQRDNPGLLTSPKPTTPSSSW